MDKVSKIKVEGDLAQAILGVVDEIGGFKKFIGSGETVLLKPNFNTADPFPASTDFEFLKTMVKLVYSAGAEKVIVGDASTMTLKTRKAMEDLNIFELEKLEHPVQVIPFDEGQWVKKQIPGAKYLKTVSVSEILGKVDKLILLPCLKTHFLAQFTGSLKLSVGFIKPSQRISLHSRHLQEKIGELNKIINPDLIIMDARKCFIDKGPSKGAAREPKLILASESRISIDIEGIKIIQGFENNSLKGVDSTEMPQIKRALEIGVN